MADGLNTAGDILNTGAGIAGMIPGYGTAISAALGVVGGFMKKGAAAEQASRAAELRQQANSVQKMPLRQEYLKSLKAQQMAALYGLPQYNQRVQQIDTGIANNIRAIKESSPSGAATLATISAVLNNANAAKNNLAIQDADMQMRKQQQVANTIWNTGDKQMDLVGLQRQDRAALNQGAMNLENAATANKIGAIDEILASVAGGVQGVTKAAQLNSNQVAASMPTGAADNSLATTGTGLDQNQMLQTLMKLKQTNPELFGATDQYGFWKKPNTFQTPSFSLGQ